MKKANILIVDDEEDILELLSYNLSREGFNIETALTGEEAVSKAFSLQIDMIILDLMLPGIDGLDVARKLKKEEKTQDIPVIMLTAKGEEVDIVTGLELGADDYITKPFSPRVLIARVKSVLRRSSDKNNESDDIIQIYKLNIHPGRRTVLLDNKSLNLTYTEFQVLHYLAKRPGWVATRSQIVDAVKGENYAVTDRSVDVQIVGLRKKMGDFGNYIQTVRGVGYRFKDKEYDQE